MFTGLVQSTGRIEKIISSGSKMMLVIDLGEAAGGVALGDSVLVSGVCLTATSITGSTVAFDVVRETVARTKLSDLRPRDKVNIELALRLNDRLGGHLVAGHVDGIGRIRAMRRSAGEVRLIVDAPPEAMRYLVEKGSVAVDGVSLTIAALAQHGFEAAVIPWTLANTALQDARAGDRVNLEGDMIGRWVLHFLSGLGGGASSPAPGEGASTAASALAKRLQDNGFLE